MSVDGGDDSHPLGLISSFGVGDKTNRQKPVNCEISCVMESSGRVRSTCATRMGPSTDRPSSGGMAVQNEETQPPRVSER